MFVAPAWPKITGGLGSCLLPSARQSDFSTSDGELLPALDGHGKQMFTLALTVGIKIESTFLSSVFSANCGSFLSGFRLLCALKLTPTVFYLLGLH